MSATRSRGASCRVSPSATTAPCSCSAGTSGSPRPCLPTQTELIGHRERLGVLAALPGITGLSQIKGIDMSDPKRCAETDAAYVAEASIGLDLRILIGTLYRA